MKRLMLCVALFCTTINTQEEKKPKQEEKTEEVEVNQQVEVEEKYEKALDTIGKLKKQLEVKQEKLSSIQAMINFD